MNRHSILQYSNTFPVKRSRKHLNSPECGTILCYFYLPAVWLRIFYNAHQIKIILIVEIMDHHVLESTRGSNKATYLFWSATDRQVLGDAGLLRCTSRYTLITSWDRVEFFLQCFDRKGICCLHLKWRCRIWRGGGREGWSSEWCLNWISFEIMDRSNLSLESYTGRSIHRLAWHVTGSSCKAILIPKHLKE